MCVQETDKPKNLTIGLSLNKLTQVIQVTVGVSLSL